MAPFLSNCSHAQTSAFISLNFGSTYSAAAVMVPKKVDEIAGQRPLGVVGKFPTKLSILDRGKPSFSFIRPGMDKHTVGEKIQFFKPLLMVAATDRDGLPEIIDYAEECLLGLDLTRNELAVAPFLEGLWREAIGLLENTLSGQQIRNSHVIICHPGSWDVDDMQGLKDAVEQTSITQHVCRDCPNGLIFCSEQEAAVYGVLSNYPEKAKELSFEDGASLIVADCGGMSIDVAMYTFHPSSEETNSSPLGTIDDEKSSMAGAMSLDLGFRKAMTEALARHSVPGPEFWDANSCRLTEEWEHFKNTYSGFPAYGSHFQFTSDKGKAIKLSRSTIVKIFDPAINAIVKHIHDMYCRAKTQGKTVKLVVLTGGLSLNPRVRNRVTTELDTRTKPEYLKVMFNTDRNSVCRGAILAHLPHEFLKKLGAELS